MRAGRTTSLAFFGSIFLVVAALTCIYELAPGSRVDPAAPFMWSDAEREWLMVSLIGLVAVGLAVCLWVREGATRARVQHWLTILLAGVTWLAGISYFYGAHGSKHAYSHLHDSYHYVLGAKYYAELGYDGLYECTAQATDFVGLADAVEARDLHTDRTVRVADLRAEPSCEERFSPARWQEFQADVEVFLATEAPVVRRVLRDRGYNGTPLHTFLAAGIANAVPLDYGTLSLFTLVDVFSLCLMLAVLCQAFGWRLGLLCAFLLFTQFVDRFLIIGGSFFRYQWLAALGLGIAWLKEERYARAGAAFAVASALNVFPVLFMVGIVLKAALSLVHTRTLSRSQKRFFVGAAVAGALSFGLGAAHSAGLDNYGAFARAMKVHDAAGRVPGFGVGLKYNFVPSRSDRGIGDGSRLRALDKWRPVIVVCAAVLLLVAGTLLPKLDDVEGALLAGFVGLFCIFGPTGYYFAFVSLLVLLWHRRAYDSGGGAMLLLLFLSVVPPYVSLLSGSIRYHAFNRWMSASWTVYIIAMLGYLAWRHRQGRPLAPRT